MGGGGAASPTPGRSARTRVKTGCLTCRGRKKACDELRPACTGCLRNYIQCRWPSPRVTANAAKPSSSISASVEDGDGQPRVWSVRGRPRSTAGARLEKLRQPENDTTTISTSGIDACLEPDDQMEESSQVMLWSRLTASYATAERAVSLHPKSILLLQHYLEATSTILAAKPVTSNPFITLVLPLAYSDDLLMHAVLALSGTHLSFRKGGDLDIQSATQRHYATLLQGLRSVLTNELSFDDPRRSLRLLLVLVVLCHVEAISGEPHGGIFPHLRASSELARKLSQMQKSRMADDFDKVKGFALEVYCYLVYVNNITPYGGHGTRILPLDTVFTPLDTLREYGTYGALLGCADGLFEYIPQVSVLAMERLAEDKKGVDSTESQSKYASLVNSISRWQSPPVPGEMLELEQQHKWAGEVYRQALFIFLEASACGSVVNNPKVMVAIQEHIDIAFPLLPFVAQSPFVTILLWPMMIIGSCLIRQDQRAEFLQALYGDSRVDVPQVFQAANLLKRLWKDEDKRAYGSFGLSLTMHKHDINFSMA